MISSLGKHALAWALGTFMVLGIGGCASSVTHHSGQIGRYYGNGVCFSVPMVQKATDVKQEDKFWEVRQGIGGADVVVLGPFVTGDAKDDGMSFRENIVLSSRSTVGISDVGQFRQQQIEALKADDSSATAFEDGQDDKDTWVDFECTEGEKTLSCRAYFFLDPQRSIGYVMVGTALKSPRLEEYRRDFADIAKTFRIGQPQSSFEIMSEVLAAAVNTDDKGLATEQKADKAVAGTSEITTSAKSK